MDKAINAVPLAVDLSHFRSAFGRLDRATGWYISLPSCPDDRSQMDLLFTDGLPPQQHYQPTPPSYQPRSARYRIRHRPHIILDAARFHGMQRRTHGFIVCRVGRLEDGKERGVLFFHPLAGG